MPAERIQEACSCAFVVEDAYPISRGHTLAIPRRHTANFFDLTSDEIASLVQLVRAARDRLDRSFKPSGYNIGVNVGQSAGQTIMHVHIHLIPRYSGDVDDPLGGVRNVIPGRGRYPS
jgi:diadenosine tetraphosphate (Ap4A) HIT family hydrolase